MRRIAAILIMLMILAINGGVIAATDEVDQYFEDTFDGDLSRWTNPRIDPAAGGRDEGSGEWVINEGALEQTDTATSFAYISPKLRKWKNFTITAKVKFGPKTGEESWFGFSVRKDANSSEARFNSCNNIMVYVRRNGRVDALRGYVGGSYIDIGVDGKQFENVQKTDEYKEYKLAVVGTKYSLSVDGKLVYEIEYPKLEGEGYISINSCVGHILVDNIKIESLVSVEQQKDNPITDQEKDSPKDTTEKTESQLQDKSKGIDSVKDTSTSGSDHSGTGIQEKTKNPKGHIAYTWSILVSGAAVLVIVYVLVLQKRKKK